MALPKKKQNEDAWEMAANLPADVFPFGYRAAYLQGQGKREKQEDSFGLVNHWDIISLRKMGLFAIVADGMGGMQGGKLASDTAVESFCSAFTQSAPLEDPVQWLRERTLLTNDRVCQLLGGQGGSTLVACLCHEEKLWFASVGDSFLYLLRGGELSRLNQMQTVLQREFLEEIRSGSADPTQGRKHKEAVALTGFLGMDDLTDVDQLLAPLPLQAGDTLLLCSDGVGGVLEEADILYCLNQGKAEDVCAALRQRVLSKEKTYQDNFTALVIQCVV